VSDSKREINTDRSISDKMLETIDLQLAYLDLDFNFIKVNSLYAKGAGRNINELIGKNHFDLFPNEENHRIFRMVRESGQSIEFQAKPFAHPDQPEKGTTYWDWVLKPVKTGDGNVTGLLLSLKEVTDRYKIWKQSKRSAFQLMLYTTLAIFIVELLIMGSIYFIFNNSFSLSILINPVLLSIVVLPILYYFFLRPLVTNLVRTERSQRILLNSFEQLEYERNRMFTILDELPASIHLVTADYKIIYANHYFKKQFGSDLDRPCYKILHGENEPCPACNVKKVFESNKGGEFEELHTNNNLYKLYNYPFTDIDGTSLVLQLGIDITKQKEYEKQLIYTEKLLTVAQMAAIISHEFRNSLTSVKMILELQRESERINKNEKNSLDVVLSSIRHMEGVVTQLLNFARPSPMEFTKANLNTIISEASEFTRLYMEKEGISLVTNLDNTIPEFFVAKTQLKEAIINLVLNAVNAISAERKSEIRKMISIATLKIEKNSSETEFKINSDGFENDKYFIQDPNSQNYFKSGEDLVVLNISDTGIGINEDDRGKIFDPFYTKNTNSGTGLGLSMVKRTIDAHRGIIKVRSKHGEGTCFSIYIPIKKSEEFVRNEDFNS
jgi:PAS domain S-box-containing protein